MSPEHGEKKCSNQSLGEHRPSSSQDMNGQQTSAIQFPIMFSHSMLTPVHLPSYNNGSSLLAAPPLLDPSQKPLLTLSSRSLSQLAPSVGLNNSNIQYPPYIIPPSLLDSGMESLLQKAKLAIKRDSEILNKDVPDSESISVKRPRKQRAKPVKEPCEHEGCCEEPIFSYEWESKARFCFEHKLVDMVDITHRVCEFIGCNKQPYFNYEHIRRGRFCFAHRLNNMVNVKHKCCEADRCNKQPSFNYPGLCNGLYCRDHKLPKMVNVKNKMCAREGCSKVPSYNFKGESRPLYCSAHKEEKMIDVISKRCEAVGCMKRPSFNFEGKVGCRFCATHKLDGMVDIISRICEYEGCRKNASCNYEGYSRRRFCCNHKLPGMVNIIVSSLWWRKREREQREEIIRGDK